MAYAAVTSAKAPLYVASQLTSSVKADALYFVLCTRNSTTPTYGFLQEQTRTSTRVDVTRHVAGTYDENTSVMKTYTSHATTTQTNPTSRELQQYPPLLHLPCFLGQRTRRVRCPSTKKCPTKGVQTAATRRVVAIAAIAFPKPRNKNANSARRMLTGFLVPLAINICFSAIFATQRR